MEIYDDLPRPIRLAMAFSPFSIPASLIRDQMRSGKIGEILRLIRLMPPSRVRSESGRWQEKYGHPSPHVAAGATVLVTEPLDPKPD
jgi:hypothetical protein